MKYDKPKIVLYNLKGYNEINGSDLSIVNEVNSIKNVLQSNGFEIINSSARWPRDVYVHDGNALIKSYIYPFLGQGGYIIQGKNFVLISSLIKNSTTLNSEKNIKKHFFKDKQIYFIEPMKINNEYISGNMHIDLTIGSIPYLDLLTVDNSHYKQQKSLFDKISRENGTTIIPIDIKKSEKRNFYNNYLVANDFVLTDSTAISLNLILEQFNINLQNLNIKMVGNPKLNGSIRCLTNIVSDKETENLIKEMEKIYDKASLIQFTTGKKTLSIEALMYLLNKESKNK